jgi:hypothetical protein
MLLRALVCVCIFYKPVQDFRLVVEIAAANSCLRCPSIAAALLRNSSLDQKEAAQDEVVCELYFINYADAVFLFIFKSPT